MYAKHNQLYGRRIHVHVRGIVIHRQTDLGYFFNDEISDEERRLRTAVLSRNLNAHQL